MLDGIANRLLEPLGVRTNKKPGEKTIVIECGLCEELYVRALSGPPIILECPKCHNATLQQIVA